MIEAFVVLIRSHDKIVNLYLIRIPFFIYPLWAKNFFVNTAP